MVRTGRTSSYGPNIQQLPRAGGVRNAVAAPPGHSLYIVDYSFIELRTLVQYARSTYGVELSVEQATVFRNKLVNEVYPELATYLSEDAYTIVAKQLRCEVQSVHNEFLKPSHLGCMRRIVRGEITKSGSDEPYPQSRIDAVWAALQRLNKNPELSAAIAEGNTSDKAGLSRRLFGTPVMTLTGRVRGRVDFTAARNTPFQGLAADGAKLAMYQLIRRGFRIAAFVHDEFVLIIPDNADWKSVPKQVDQIICDSMQSVCGTVPIAVEGARAKRWFKNAEPTRDCDGTLLPWTPPDEKTD